MGGPAVRSDFGAPTEPTGGYPLTTALMWAAISSGVPILLTILLTTPSAPAARAHASKSCFTVALMSSTTVPGFALCTSSMSWTKVLEKEWSLARCAYPGPQLY
jgi:hypothetical protein